MSAGWFSQWYSDDWFRDWFVEPSGPVHLHAEIDTQNRFSTSAAATGGRMPSALDSAYFPGFIPDRRRRKKKVEPKPELKPLPVHRLITVRSVLPGVRSSVRGRLIRPRHGRLQGGQLHQHSSARGAVDLRPVEDLEAVLMLCACE